MRHSRLYRLILLHTLCLVCLLAIAPGVSAHSLSHNLKSSTRSVQPLTCPRVGKFSPAGGAPGTSVTISGCGFTGSTGVTFQGVSASFTINSDTQITATVPAGAISGKIAVVTPTKTVKSSTSFLVAAAITLSPTAGPPGSTLSVSGTGFGKEEAIDIYFDTTDEALASANLQGAFAGTSIQVPTTAVPGTHTITAIGRHSGISAQTPFLVQTNWNQFRGTPQHQGVNPYENVLGPSNVGNLDVAWSAAVGGIIDSSPAVANGIAYVGAEDGNLYAFNIQTGTQLWSASTGNIILSSPAVANGVVYIGSLNGNLYAFDALSGHQLWSSPTSVAISSSPTVVNGVVYIGAVNPGPFSGGLYAFNATSGVLLWSDTTGPIAYSSPAVLNGIVYIGSLDGNLYAFNAQSGSELWSSPTGPAVYSTPAVLDGVVYVGSYDGSLYAFNAQSGVQLWSTAIDSLLILSSPAVSNGVVYVGSDNNNLYALNAQTGTQLWSAPTGASIASSPAIANGVVYVGSYDGNLYAFSTQTGTRLWSAPTGSSITYSSPAVADGVLYIGSSNARLYAFALPPQDHLKPPPPPNPATLHPNLKLHLQV